MFSWQWLAMSLWVTVSRCRPERRLGLNVPQFIGRLGSLWTAAVGSVSKIPGTCGMEQDRSLHILNNGPLALPCWSPSGKESGAEPATAPRPKMAQVVARTFLDPSIRGPAAPRTSRTAQRWQKEPSQQLILSHYALKVDVTRHLSSQQSFCRDF